jgi:DNA invertase Pin-like site-specific DNA recombinase
MAGVNQLERDLIRMRQREGIELAKKEGKFKGRLKKYHKLLLFLTNKKLAITYIQQLVTIMKNSTV